MKKNHVRILAALLALLLVGCSAPMKGNSTAPATAAMTTSAAAASTAASASTTAGQTTTAKQTTAATKATTTTTKVTTMTTAATTTTAASIRDLIDTSLDRDGAFAAANECYRQGDYDFAESYYLLALEGDEAGSLYSDGDIRNNLVLTLLQQERNEEAFDLCVELVSGDSDEADEVRFGHLINLLVCGEACGKGIRETMEALPDTTAASEDAEWLGMVAEIDPGNDGKLAAAYLYNAIYIDMEGTMKDWFESYSFYPVVDTDSSGMSMYNAFDTMLEILDALGEEEAEELMSQSIFLETLSEMLRATADWDEQAFGERDPDFDELLTYLEALIAEASQT